MKFLRVFFSGGKLPNTEALFNIRKLKSPKKKYTGNRKMSYHLKAQRTDILFSCSRAFQWTVCPSVYFKAVNILLFNKCIIIIEHRQCFLCQRHVDFSWGKSWPNYYHTVWSYFHFTLGHSRSENPWGLLTC